MRRASLILNRCVTLIQYKIKICSADSELSLSILQKSTRSLDTISDRPFEHFDLDTEPKTFDQHPVSKSQLLKLVRGNIIYKWRIYPVMAMGALYNVIQSNPYSTLCLGVACLCAVTSWVMVKGLQKRNGELKTQLANLISLGDLGIHKSKPNEVVDNLLNISSKAIALMNQNCTLKETLEAERKQTAEVHQAFILLYQIDQTLREAANEYKTQVDELVSSIADIRANIEFGKGLEHIIQKARTAISRDPASKAMLAIAEAEMASSKSATDINEKINERIRRE